MTVIALLVPVIAVLILFGMDALENWLFPPAQAGDERAPHERAARE